MRKQLLPPANWHAEVTMQAFGWGLRIVEQQAGLTKLLQTVGGRRVLVNARSACVTPSAAGRCEQGKTFEHSKKPCVFSVVRMVESDAFLYE